MIDLIPALEVHTPLRITSHLLQAHDVAVVVHGGIQIHDPQLGVPRTQNSYQCHCCLL